MKGNSMANYSKGSQTPRCSFCGKDAKMVDRLVAGPGVYICNECVELCNSILDDGTVPEETERRFSTPARKNFPCPLK